MKNHGVREPEARHLAQAEALVFSEKPSAHIHFPGNVTVRREYGILTAQEGEPALEPMTLTCPGTLELPDCRIECTPAKKIINTPNVFTVSCGERITVRCRQTGDTMRLPGGTRSLKKLFVDRKIPAAQRDAIPVIADEQGVLAVGGIGVNLDRVADKLPAWQIKIVISSEIGCE